MDLESPPEESKTNWLKEMSFSVQPISHHAASSMDTNWWVQAEDLKQAESHINHHDLILSYSYPLKSQGNLIPTFHLSDKKDLPISMN
jgi:hypothetical protein